MLGEGDVRTGRQLRQPGVHHGLRTGALLLGRLEQGDEGARPLIAVVGHPLCRRDQGRHVHVMPAAVHHVHLLATRPRGRLGAGVVQPGLLLQGQGVHIRSGQDHRSLTLGEDPHHAGGPHVLVHLEPGLPQRLRRDPRCPGLLVAQLRVGVQVLIELQLAFSELGNAGQGSAAVREESFMELTL